ncbi:iron-sulfur cluster repair di-iron protein [Gillisia sp. Q332]|uniref:iron-sulfur cluster repair di-iron protein n=1 Tax=Gillisia xinjiangensis TaxID=3384765 RepID=UPI003919444E
MTITKEKIVGELVAEDYRTAQIFKNHKIDFCCNGNRSIETVCETGSIPLDTLLDEIATLQKANTDSANDYKTWPLDLLADYIIKKHHRYVATRSSEIVPYLEKLCKVHGERHNELFTINEEFKASVGELAAHMKKEELILFPFIKKMVEAKEEGKEIPLPNFGTVENPVEMMKEEHDVEGERFRKIAGLTNNYQVPADACNTYRVTFSLLKEFEEDLQLHIHLENNILFPKAIALEKELRS